MYACIHNTICGYIYCMYIYIYIQLSYMVYNNIYNILYIYTFCLKKNAGLLYHSDSAGLTFWVFGLVRVSRSTRGHRAKSQTDRKPAVTGKDRWRPNSKSLDHEPSVLCPVVMSQNPGTQRKPWFPKDTLVTG